MNRDRIEGNWKQLKGEIEQHWGKLTDDDLDRIAGKREELEGRLQKAYGYGRDKVKAEIDVCRASRDRRPSPARPGPSARTRPPTTQQGS